MTVARDAFTYYATSFNPSDTFSHTPVGTPRGVVIELIQGSDDVGTVTVTYGGVALTEVASSPSSNASENAVVYTFFLGSGVPTGTQTVSVSRSGGSGNLRASVYTLTAAGDTEVVDDASATGSGADPSVSLALSSRSSFCSLVFRSGNSGGYSPLTGWTSEATAFDVYGWYSYDTIGTADVTAGFTATADQYCLISIAVSEVVGGTAYTQSLAGAFTPSGALVTASVFGRVLAGSVAPLGSISRLTARSFIGSLTPTGIANKLTTKDFAGTLALSGATSKETQKSFSGNVTPSGALSTTIVFLRTLAGALTPSGALSKLTLKNLLSALTPSGAVNKLTAKALVGGVTPAGVTSKQTQKNFDGSVTPAGDAVPSLTSLQAAAGSLTPTGAMTPVFQAFVASVISSYRRFTTVLSSLRHGKR